MASTVRKPANMYSDPSKVVCVTGAGGFIASWLVKVLLDRGYTVRGTARNPDHSKNYHLWGLEGAKERLTLHKADILDYMSLKEAMRGCGGVFHTAFPVTNDPGEVLIGAINGTKNVVKAAADAKVKRVVFTSSIGAVHMDPNRGPDVVVDENCWSDLDYCKKTENWYCYGKVVAERAASEMARQRGVELVVVIPVVSVGAMLQTTLNASSLQILKYLKGHKKTYANAVQGFVHVKDVAEAHLLVYENPSAHGRYLCTAGFWHRGEFFKILSELFPEYPLPSRCSDEVNPMVKPYKFSNQRLKDLGLQFTPIQKGLCELVKCFQDFGHLQDPAQPRENPIPHIRTNSRL